MSAVVATMKQRGARVADVLMLAAGLAVFWQLLYELIGSAGMAPPLPTVLRAYDMLISEDDFWMNVGATFSALGVSLAVEIVLGLLVGLALGLNRTAGAVFEPILVASYSMPKIVFYPIILMFFGIDMASKVVFGVIHGFFPIALFTMNAVRTIRPVYLKAGRVMRLTRWQVMWTIAAPSAVPEIFTGLRIGFSTTFIGVLFSEMFSSKSGIGFLLINAVGLDQVGRIMALTFLIAAFALVVNSVLVAIDHRLHQRK